MRRSTFQLPSVVVGWCVALIAHAGESTPVRWTPEAIATDRYESSATFTPDGREMFFMSSDAAFSRYRLLWSSCRDGRWSLPRKPLFAADDSILEADPFVTADGKRLYFISARQGDKEDDFDIWSVDREADGSFVTAKRLPEPVNSPDVELLPRMTTDGRLYFGSDRPGGHGLMDIYVASADAKGAWKVENLGPPVNSAASEYEADISRDRRTLIVVANRDKRSHLYRYTLERGEWIGRGQIPAREEVFQVGPLLSPSADRLLFAQADGQRSGELFLIDLVPEPDRTWPPACASAAGR